MPKSHLEYLEWSLHVYIRLRGGWGVWRGCYIGKVECFQGKVGGGAEGSKKRTRWTLLTILLLLHATIAVMPHPPRLTLIGGGA